eukprot:gene18388-44357_t
MSPSARVPCDGGAPADGINNDDLQAELAARQKSYARLVNHHRFSAPAARPPPAAHGCTAHRPHGCAMGGARSCRTEGEIDVGATGVGGGNAGGS